MEAHPDPLVEALAALSHDQWAGWTRWMLDCLKSPDREAHIARWERQIQTPYANLSEAEKESDRKEARRMVKVFTEVLRQARLDLMSMKGW